MRTKIPLKNDFLKELDVMPMREHMLEKVRMIAKKIGAFYGFQKLSTSIVEDYKRLQPLQREGFFDMTPPVSAKTRNGMEIFLRPSGVLGALRAYCDYGMSDSSHPVKLCFEGEAFVAGSDGTVSGRYEMGFLMLGEMGPVAEAELFQIMHKTLEELGIKPEEVSLKLNAVGCSACRPPFRTSLTAYARSKVNRLCKNCKRDFRRSPARMLACREEKCAQLMRNAPQMLDYLCEQCKKHLKGVLEFLDEMDIPYFLDHTFFSEGTVYTHLVFQLLYADASKPLVPAAEGETTPQDGVAQEKVNSVCIIAEGGRAAQAAEIIAGQKMDAVAAVFLLDSLEEVLTRQHSSLAHVTVPKVFLVQLGELARRKSMAVIEKLREAGMEVAEILGKDSIKTQLKTAEKMSVRLTLILGQKEAIDNTVIVREVDSGVQETIPQEKLIEFLNRKLV